MGMYFLRTRGPVPSLQRRADLDALMISRSSSRSHPGLILDGSYDGNPKLIGNRPSLGVEASAQPWDRSKGDETTKWNLNGSVVMGCSRPLERTTTVCEYVFL